MRGVRVCGIGLKGKKSRSASNGSNLLHGCRSVTASFEREAARAACHGSAALRSPTHTPPERAAAAEPVPAHGAQERPRSGPAATKWIPSNGGGGRSTGATPR